MAERMIRVPSPDGRPAFVFGLARTGSSYSNGSGDYAIAFSTSKSQPLSTDAISPLFQMTLEATEEAVYNSLLRATTIRSRSGSAEAIPIERVRAILSKYGVVQRRGAVPN